MCTHLHTYIQTYIHASIHPPIHTYIHTYIYTYTLTHTHTYIHTHIRSFGMRYQKSAYHIVQTIRQTTMSHVQKQVNVWSKPTLGARGLRNGWIEKRDKVKGFGQSKWEIDSAAGPDWEIILKNPRVSKANALPILVREPNPIFWVFGFIFGGQSSPCFSESILC